MDSNQQRALLSYLGLPEDYAPSPSAEPIQFLQRHLCIIPPHLITQFSSNTTPKQRTVIPAIRNRRSQYVSLNPAELSLTAAKRTWPTLWEGREFRGEEEAAEEEEWVKKEFLQGKEQHVGKLGTLLGGYVEERELQRMREIRRKEAEYRESLPEEDEDTEEDEMDAATNDKDSPEEMQSSFLRLVKERFIYGLLEVCVPIALEF
ncbi:hypothetical protein BXZ70DRAFT_408531 [Cristinia sonorae]|uniref:CCD97-like C-terminal domain-containing protein n=1 Tax=Cristinia sonorae TaxID=1940300 RepID=A0A8K0UWB4_9AGAR|nr:hypothetical protein BXZ70DRAFT_408531 [Cristinia sonorae]